MLNVIFTKYLSWVRKPWFIHIVTITIVYLSFRFSFLRPRDGMELWDWEIFIFDWGPLTIAGIAGIPAVHKIIDMYQNGRREAFKLKVNKIQTMNFEQFAKTLELLLTNRGYKVVSKSKLEWSVLKDNRPIAVNIEAWNKIPSSFLINKLTKKGAETILVTREVVDKTMQFPAFITIIDLNDFLSTVDS